MISPRSARSSGPIRFTPRHARARWKLAGDGKSWTVEQLEFTSPLGVVRAEGCVPPTPDHGAWFDASLDLAALARQLPQTLHLRDDLRLERWNGPACGPISYRIQRGDTHVCNVSGKVTDLIAHQGAKTLTLPDPATLNAKIRRTGDALSLERLEIQTPFMTVDGQGDLDHGIVVTAALDLAVFRDRFRRLDRTGRRRARRQRKAERLLPASRGGF